MITREGAGQVSVAVAPPKPPSALTALNTTDRARRGRAPAAPRRDPNDWSEAADVAARAELRRALLLSGRVELFEIEAASALERSVAQSHTPDYDPHSAPQPLRSRTPDYVCNPSAQATVSRSASAGGDSYTSVSVWVQLMRGGAALGAGQDRESGLTGFEPTSIRTRVLNALRSIMASVPFQARVIVSPTDGHAFLNLGSDAGVRVGQYFSISRGGEPIGEVQITRVGTSTAAVLRAGQQPELRDGDIAFFEH
jgi:hypothetical protein